MIHKICISDFYSLTLSNIHFRLYSVSEDRMWHAFILVILISSSVGSSPIFAFSFSRWSSKSFKGILKSFILRLIGKLGGDRNVVSKDDCPAVARSLIPLWLIAWMKNRTRVSSLEIRAYDILHIVQNSLAVKKSECLYVVGNFLDYIGLILQWTPMN